MKFDAYAAGISATLLICLYQQYLIQSLQTSILNQPTSSSLQSTLVIPPSTQANTQTLKSLVGEGFEQQFFPEPIAPKLMQIANDQRAAGGSQSRIYGGAGDEVHLGGFTQRDNNTISFNTWNYMLGPLAVKSFVDIGCGRGFSTKYFKDNGARVLCVEGSHDAIKHSLLPRENIVQHDYTKGIWYPRETFDVAWSTEFLEHLGRQYMANYIPTLKRAAIIMVTASGWGGYHHVEVHDRDWWIYRFGLHGLIYSPELSNDIRLQTRPDRAQKSGQVVSGVMAFINPAVASLPQHAHLIGGHGCYGGKIDNIDGGVPCVGADELPVQYQSLLNCDKKETGRNMETSTWSKIHWSCQPNHAARTAAAAGKGDAN